MRALPLLSLSLVCVALARDGSSPGELLSVSVLTRHGSRAPDPAAGNICPSLANGAAEIEQDFGVGPGLLTEVGAKQIEDVGDFLRRRYLEGEGALLQMPAGEDASEHLAHFHFQAPSESRLAKSASILAKTLLPNLPTPHVVTDPADTNNLLAAPPAACNDANRERVFRWMNDVGNPFFYSTQQPAVRAVERICGRDLKPDDILTDGTQTKGNPHPPFQDMVDLIDFRAEQGMPYPIGYADVRDAAEEISYNGIVSRLFGTQSQRVYWMGQFPGRVLETMRNSAEPSPPPLRFSAYVASREIHYAAEQYFNFSFNVPQVPQGAIIPGTTILFELWRRGDELDVRVGYYYKNRQTGFPDMTWVKMGFCGAEACPLETFAAHMADMERSAGGDFEQLCGAATLWAAERPAAQTILPLAAAGALTATVGVLAVIFQGGRARRAADYHQLGDA